MQVLSQIFMLFGPFILPDMQFILMGEPIKWFQVVWLDALHFYSTCILALISLMLENSFLSLLLSHKLSVKPLNNTIPQPSNNEMEEENFDRFLKHGSFLFQKKKKHHH